MNRHTKLAIIIAPILVVLGYIGSDYYLEETAQKGQVFELKTEGRCDVLMQKCVLNSGDFKVNVFDKKGYTTVNSTFPLDSVILFLVDENNQAIPYPLGMQETAYYWHSKTPLRENFAASGKVQKLRLIAKIKGGQYIGEFLTPASN